MTNELKEFTYANEQDAHKARRRMIDRGRRVSLIALDPARDLYVFDAETQDPDLEK